MGYSWEYFKPEFWPLGPLVSIFQGFESQPPGFPERVFWSFVKNGKNGKINSGNIFDHNEDILGTILRPISGL